MQDDPRDASTILGLIAVSVVAVACATAAAPTGQLAIGTASVDAARSAGAVQYAPYDIESARAKLERARALARDGQNAQALALAEEADVDAQVARSKAAALRARHAADEARASLAALRRQAERSGTGAPAAP